MERKREEEGKEEEKVETSEIGAVACAAVPAGGNCLCGGWSLEIWSEGGVLKLMGNGGQRETWWGRLRDREKQLGLAPKNRCLMRLRSSINVKEKLLLPRR